MKKIWLAAASVTLGAAASAAVLLPVTSSAAVRPDHAPRCVHVTVGFTTRTGAEADAPVRICGLPERPSSGVSYPCWVIKGHWGGPNQRWACKTPPVSEAAGS